MILAVRVVIMALRWTIWESTSLGGRNDGKGQHGGKQKSTEGVHGNNGRKAVVV